MKVFAKGSFFIYIDSNNNTWIDNRENVLVWKNNTSSTSYNILLKSKNKNFTDLEFTSIQDEAGSIYASQSVFETYVYENTGIRVSSSPTDLSYTSSSTNGIVISSSGTDATIPLANVTNAGLLTPADFTKLTNTSGTNSGNQTTIVGITGTKSQFDTACTDGDFAYQTDLASKQNTITGGAITIVSSGLTASKALISNASGKVAVSSVTDTELGYLSGVTSSIQTQINTISSGTISQYSPRETFRGVNYVNNSITETTSGGITISTTGSTIARSVATTNYATKQIRKGFYASVVSGGRYTETRGSALLWYVGGGFRYVCDVYISDTVYASGCRQFYGMMGQTSSLTYSDIVLVETMVNVIGFGSDSSDTNIQVFSNDATGTCTKVDLGSSFPANRSVGSALTAIYSFELYNDYSGNVLYKAVNNETGVIVEGTITTNLPATTQGLNFVASRCMGGGGGTTNSGQFDLALLGVYSI